MNSGSVKRIQVIDSNEKSGGKLPGVAERILKKQKQSSGQIKYLVKWRGQGNDEATWECEEAMQSAHKELIEDFNFFALTGERYDDKLLETRRKHHYHGNGNYIPTLADDEEQPASGYTIKRARKLPGACRPALKEMKEKDVDESFESKRDKKSQKGLIKLDLRPSVIDLHSQLGGQKSKSQLVNQQQCMVKDLSEQYAGSEDVIERVGLQLNGKKGVFEVQWGKRQNGQNPFSEFYGYESFRLVAPLLMIEFFESAVMGRNKSEIKQQMVMVYYYYFRYVGPGQSIEENRKILQRFLLGEEQQQEIEIESTGESVSKNEETRHVKQEMNKEQKESRILNLESEEVDE